VYEPVFVRTARAEDEASLARIDLATWSTLTSPAPRPDAALPFFGERNNPRDVLVAIADDAPAGFIKLRSAWPIPAGAHVMMIDGIAVDPARQRRGIGRALVDAAVHDARVGGARRMTLRVLGHNTGAQRLYESCGFVVEGVLRDEFLLDGRYVDDILMALDLTVVAP
jgi:ribosomal protein S18 acetylase RimI-like enzyme